MLSRQRPLTVPPTRTTAKRKKPGTLLFRIFAAALPLLLAGYLLFNRGFAWIHLPKTPIFIGETVLGLGIAWALTSRRPSRKITAHSPPLILLGIFMAWGALLAVPRLSSHGVDTVRDSAVWYYGAFAFLVVLLFASSPSVLSRWLERYERFLPALVTWLPLGFFLGTTLTTALAVPDSNVSVLSHGPGTMSVQAAAGVIFIWVARPDHRDRRPGWHAYITVLGLIMVVLAATQSRSGFIATSIGLVLAVALKPGRRLRMLSAGVGTLTLVLVLGLLFAADAPVSGKNRALSTDQIRENVTSIFDPGGASGNLAGTAAWRLEYWQAVVDDVVSDRPLFGYGFGVNIREIYGFQQEDPPSRNTHNSHVNVFARMGTPGLALWVVMWVAWFAAALGARRRLIARGRLDDAGLMSWLVVAAAMPLVHAYFTSTLESPQVAIWLWTIFGTGAFLAYRAQRGEDAVHSDLSGQANHRMGVAASPRRPTFTSL